MKTHVLARRVTLLLCLAPWLAFSLQLPFQRPQKQQNPFHSPHPSQPQQTLTPYTTPWVNELQAVYNAFGEHRNDSKCPTDIEKWTCQPYDLTEADLVRPTDVWHLRAHDIKAVVSIGDSISAGFAMISGRPPFATVFEFRGKVFSGGGDKGEYTLANFLKTYGTRLQGSPSGVTLPLAHGKGLNTAVSGAIAQTLPSQIDRLKWQFGLAGPYRKYKKEWKLATVFVGANNLCAACTDGDNLPAVASPEDYAVALKTALIDLRDSIGPTFVNLVGIFDVSLVYELSRGYPYCEMMFDKMPVPICSCATSKEDNRKKVGDLAEQYNDVMRKVAKEVNDESDSASYGVVFQPGLTEFKDGSFHPNRCANQVMAISLWNNMFSSADGKDKPMKPDDLEIFCPGPTDYLK
ncbi:hypothetical protein BG015_000333 [Linnemannia schmuckeri]|uniref:Uncharacterized protein n=1 Tax=Linnemannia schmuckeri TaxID=64567 RepID=A0A9P5S6T5_9FUNG|nr:hypothetical protein BG015_000333 [Linnemannia schmuckeri]